MPGQGRPGSPEHEDPDADPPGPGAVFCMDTKRLTTSKEDLAEAGRILAAGGLVAFPTETVYGLGADARDPEAVRRIYTVKGRPADNPSIVHIADPEALVTAAREIPETAHILAEAFWPGPLTMILKRDPSIPDVTTGGLDTVGIRMPDSAAARGLIRAAGCPVAAPSANISGKPSPTEAQHVLDDFDGRIEAVIDGGPCRVGIESTVLDLSGGEPMILRPGILTKEDFERALGRPVVLDPALNVRPDASRASAHPKAPGQKYKHYAPNAPMILYRGEPGAVRRAMEAEQRRREQAGEQVVVIDFDAAHEVEAAHAFFRILREADKSGADIILAAALPEEGVGFSVMNRMLKSSGFHIVNV